MPCASTASSLAAAPVRATREAVSSSFVWKTNCSKGLAPSGRSTSGSWARAAQARLADVQECVPAGQRRVERRHYRQRFDLMMYEKQRQETLKDLGADPYVD